MTGRRARALAAAAGLAAWLSPAQADPDVAVWMDLSGDATIRRTDPGADGPIGPGCNLPDVVSVTLSGWEAFDPKGDPYTGQVVDEAHLVRLEVTFRGTVNPPGPLGLNGDAYDPLRFGPSPIFGFLDVDIDGRKDSGGVLGASAQQRYLANVARFGRVPYDSIGERAARSADDYDGNFYSGPQFERSGADWDLAFCGCFAVTIVSEGGDGDQVFDAGETWIVQGRFFERVSGFVDASYAYNGSGFGRYDPKVNLRFSHSTGADETTVTLVYGLDMAGAWALSDDPKQEDIDLDVSNQTSIVEGLQDVIDNAGGLSGPVGELTKDWEGRDPFDYLDPTRWEVSALFGTAYTTPAGALYVWTDTGFAETFADVNGDGEAGALDRQMVLGELYQLDGTDGDGDGAKDGRVQIPGFGLNFSLYDLDGDGWIDGEDLWAFGHPADLDGNGVLNIFDFLTFQNLYAAKVPDADFNLDGEFSLFDFLAFVNAFNK